MTGRDRLTRRDLCCLMTAFLAAPLWGCRDRTPDCNDVTKINDNSRKVRAELRYATQTLKASQTCDNCGLYEPPTGKAACGGCQLFDGPVTAKGWCVNWVATGS